jgi:predicted nucleic acid-binding protein
VLKVFVDTVAWIALLNVSDALHARAQQVMSALRQQKVRLVTTEFVLLEVADALSAPTIRVQTVAFINGLRQLSILQIVPVSPTLFADGWTLYSQRHDKEWGLTDCTSFVVMTQKQITQAFTSDHHFEQAGFNCSLT